MLVRGQSTQIGSGMDRPAPAGLARARHEFLGRCPRLPMNTAPLALNTYKSLGLTPRDSGRELVDGSVVVIAPMNGGAVKVSEPIDNHPVIGKRAIWRTLEEMNYSLGPLAAANGT